MKIDPALDTSQDSFGDEHFSASEETPLREDAFILSDEEKIERISQNVREIMLTLGLDLDDDSLNAADLARRAGYDGVEIMGSEGYLINQFICTHTNQREDEWGGSLENRTRFSRDILQRVRLACGEDFIIGLSISDDPVTKYVKRCPSRAPFPCACVSG